MEKRKDQFVPVVLFEDNWFINTAGFHQQCFAEKKPRNGFYVVSGRKPDGVDYVHPNVYSYDMTVDEIRTIYPEATLGDFFPEEIQEWIMRSYQFGVNPLPYLREVYTEYNFKFVERGVATPDVPLPAPGSTILVFRDGGMAVMGKAFNQNYEVDDNDPVPSLAIPG